MRPAPCPSLLKELIKRANARPLEESEPLRLIARPFRAKRKAKRKRRTVKIESRNVITISLEDGRVSATDALTLALDQVDPASKIDLIRECQICSQIFWAGRSDSEACARHAERWRKREQRRKKGERDAKRASSRAKRKERRADRPVRISRTSSAILAALANRCRFWKTIDDYCYSELRATRRHEGKYRTATVKRCLGMLLDLGFVTCADTTPKNPYYAPTEKINRYHREGLFIFEETDSP